MQTDICKGDDESGTWDEPATAVVMMVADAKDADPLDLDSLYEVVDPDALAGLVSRSEGPVRIEFEYEGYAVTVRSDGHVHIE
ncbi:HalOD1 output domain-containing protein [Halosolutus halophilus]|uniref:HalOD1 output domain-containing protein n=1 Tax=Halosolutus halophilus TaxID=1552990 RepID=UPI002234F821|nr:HalOD1 output domain-containing protein [Halosolutus halophilus]